MVAEDSAVAVEAVVAEALAAVVAVVEEEPQVAVVAAEDSAAVVEAVVALEAAVEEEVLEPEPRCSSSLTRDSQESSSVEEKTMCSSPRTRPQVRASTMRNVLPLKYVTNLNIFPLIDKQVNGFGLLKPLWKKIVHTTYGSEMGYLPISDGFCQSSMNCLLITLFISFRPRMPTESQSRPSTVPGTHSDPSSQLVSSEVLVKST